MSEYYGYPENDWRNYLMHWGKGGEAKHHKYISRHKGKSGKWIYTYATLKPNAKPDGYINSKGKKIYYDDQEEFERNNNTNPTPDGYLNRDGGLSYKKSGKLTTTTVTLSPNAKPDGYINSKGKKVYYKDQEDFKKHNNTSPKPDRVSYPYKAKGVRKNKKKSRVKKFLSSLFN